MVKSYCLAGLSMQFRACLLRTSSLTVLEGHGSFKHHCIHCSKNPTSSQSMHFQLGTSAGESSSLGNSPYAGVGAWGEAF